MTQGQGSARIVIGVSKLIVELQNVFYRIERSRAVRVHDEMGNGLVGKEIRLFF
jgi:hypothetical protein